MAFDRFLIAPSQTGLQTDMRAWLINDDAWSTLDNAYIFRGRLKKRFGSRLMGSGWSSALTEPLFSRLRINLGNTDGAGNIAGNVPGAIFKVGQLFSVGDEIFTVTVTGAPGVMLTTGASTVHTYDTTTGAYVITGAAAATPLFFYPAEPVMGFTNYEVGAINNFPSYAFDTQFIYVFTGGAWARSGTAVFHGTNLNFFWTTNYRGATANITSMFTTNFNATIGAPGGNDDPMYYTNDGATWASFSPYTIFLTGGNFVQTCRLIVSFKNRLLLLNTIEQATAGPTNTAYVNRCRYSHNGSPFANNAWLEPNNTNAGSTADGAGFLDAPTEEQIISAEFIKDRLIVYFERSTWELAYTGNALLPFVWQKLNTELGSESQNSTVPFDREVLTIGNTGVHACNGSNVVRIDNKIPDQIFEIVDKNLGVQRVAGIRDYFVEMVYWCFPSIEQNSANVYPEKVLVYNYKNGAWAFNDESITAFGYFEQQLGTTWTSTTLSWEDANMAWASGTVQAQFRQVIAGNQEGFIFIVDSTVSRNARYLQISAVTQMGPFANLTIIDHTLNDDDYIAIENLQGVTFTNPQSDTPGSYIFQVAFIDTNTVAVLSTFTGVYTGGGTASRVSNFNFQSKQWNPYVNKGQNVYLARIDFGVQATDAGQVVVDYYPSATELSMVDEGTVTGAIMGNNVLETSPYDPIYYPLEQEQERLWHPVYFQTEGECIQLAIYMNKQQITNPLIAFEDFELEGLVLHTMSVSTRLQ